jgi:hypothetical protein
MGADPIRQAVVDRSDLEIDGLDGTEGAFDIPFVMPLII